MMLNSSSRGLILALILVLGAALVGCGERRQAPAVAPETVQGLAVVTAQRQAVPDTLEAVGTVRAAQTSQVASQLLANIVEIRASEGTRVSKGDLLAVLDDAQPRAARERAKAALLAADQEVAAAKADLDLATATLRRYQDLFEKKSVSPQEFDEVAARHRGATARREMAAAGLEQARAAVAQATSVFDFTRIRAPFDGLVTEKRADAGTLAAPGMVLFVVEDTQRFRLEVTVDESEIRYVTLEQAVLVVIDALAPEELRGRVVQTVPSVDPASRSFLVKVELPADALLRSGLFGRALFARGERQGLLIPRTAVVDRGQLEGVYVLGADNIASLRYVALGKPLGPQVEVLSGLEAGERVVVEPRERDLAGKRIEVGEP
jgi:multidrug efflux system membrane fusion protein